MAPNRGNEDWCSIAEETSKEMDPAKLMILIGKLCRALDKRNERKAPMQYPFPADQASRGLCEMTMPDGALGTHLAASSGVEPDAMANRGGV
jgi:hypothetical protein